VFTIDDSTALRPLVLADAREVFAVVDANRAYLRRWLPWVDAVLSEEHSREFVESAVAQRESGRGPTFAILQRDALVGLIGFHPIDRIHCVGEIGYWLAEAAQGRGIMTACCRFVVRYGFYTLDLHRIQIPAAVANRRSRAIPERLGFTLEGIMRGRENLHGTFVDHALYALLRADLPADF
jgi:ribosomal-protein-serine acetyltransferase